MMDCGRANACGRFPLEESPLDEQVRKRNGVEPSWLAVEEAWSRVVWNVDDNTSNDATLRAVGRPGRRRSVEELSATSTADRDG